jgi:hypothetical protein
MTVEQTNLTNRVRADGLLAGDGAADLAPLIGSWINTDTDTNHFIRVVTALDPEGRFTVRMFGADDAGPIDWGEREAMPFVTGKTLQGVGFHTRYKFDDAETLIAANHSKGVLVIQAYTEFRDGSGRPNYFSREFFHQ